MISTTYASTAVLLLNDAPDWSSKFSASFDLVSQFEEGLTTRETRRAHAATLRCKLGFRITASDNYALALSSVLRTYQAQPVVVPFWPAAQAWASRSSIATTGGLRVAYTADWSTWQIYDASGSEPTWPAATDYVAPLLWGRLEKRDLSWIAPNAVQFPVDFTEASPASYALAPNAVTFPAGPQPAAYATAPRLFPLPLDWRDIPETFRFQVLRDQLGFGRAPLETTYPGQMRRESDFRTYTASISDVWTLLRFFLDHGAGTSFWAPTWRSAATMAADLSAGSTALTITGPTDILAGDYIAFLVGSTIGAAGRVLSISGSTVTLTAAVGAFAASQTVVAPINLVRVEKPHLSVSWLNQEVAEAEFSIVEVPAEYSPASDETLGTTIGSLMTRAFLYKISMAPGGTSVLTLATSYESTITVVLPYLARKITHGAIKQGVNIDRDEVEVRTEIIAGDPFTLAATGQAETPVHVEIYALELSGGTVMSVTGVFTGDVISAQIRGNEISAKLVSAGSVFDRLCPRMRLQVGCNHVVYSPGCGLSAAALKFTAQMANPGTVGWPFTFTLDTFTFAGGAVPSLVAGYFAGGYIEFGTGSSMSRRAIIASTAISSGAVTITLARDPVTFPSIGDTVALYAGCDGAFSTCSGKFGNQLNFGGMPFLPIANPSLVKLDSNIGGGKK